MTAPVRHSGILPLTGMWSPILVNLIIDQSESGNVTVHAILICGCPLFGCLYKYRMIGAGQILNHVKFTHPERSANFDTVSGRTLNS